MNSHSNSNPNSPTSLSSKLSSSFNSNSKAKSVSTDSNSNSDGSSRCHRTGFKNEVEVNIEMGKWNGDSEFDDFGLKTIKPNVLKEQEEINEIEDGEIENDEESRELLDDGDKKGYRVSRERSKLEVNDAELNNDSDGGRGREQREVGIEFFGDIPKLPCRICDVVLPLRARHCVKCQRCVMKFDHHCFLIANCVGQNNHVLFYTYLFFESVLTWKCMILNLSLLFNLPSLHFTTDILLFISLLIVVSFTGICTGLLIFHSYLILTNLTTWEYLRGPRSIHGNRVPYLALDQYGIDLQREDVFSHGVFMNCLVFWGRSVAFVPSMKRWLEVKENYDGRRIPSGRAGKQGLVSRIWKMCF
ncbi:DHHC palmitoyltransferase-domain-containing protein [Paraphysoderma sedebokerense]|nr:DHHC palmitoyltransferase-domain-containing protein [Paraphysoderma sedebokerense]